MNLEDLDWAALDRLRDLFLASQPIRTAYWRNGHDLACYDATFGERIGWKWDAVLRALVAQTKGVWSPPLGPLLDFGCGSGIAGRRVLSVFGESTFSALHLHDKARLAEDFAADQARSKFPTIPIVNGNPEVAFESGQPVTLLVSHVLNELSTSDTRRLMALARRASAILWVEPGTSLASRQLIGVREALRGEFTILRPCPHQKTCGLLTAARQADWCHHFAAPPPGLSMDPFWVRFARQAGIDLRSLPYSHLVLARQDSAPPELIANRTGEHRVIGRPRSFKGYLEVLNCGDGKVEQLTLQRRDQPELADRLEETDEAILARWMIQGTRIRGGVIVEPQSISSPEPLP